MEAITCNMLALCKVCLRHMYACEAARSVSQNLANLHLWCLDGYSMARIASGVQVSEDVRRSYG